jgi:hypothetical protein
MAGGDAERWTSNERSSTDSRPREQADDPFEDWERYPATQADESIEYQKVAWYGASFGDAGVAVLVLAVVLNVLRRIGREVIRRLVF